MIEYKDIEKIVYLIPERNFYDGVIDSKVAREYQAYIEFQSQKYNQTKRKCDWDELKRLNAEYERYLANEVDVKRKLLWFGLLRRRKEEMEEECLKLIERFHCIDEIFGCCRWMNFDRTICSYCFFKLDEEEKRRYDDY